MKSREGSCSTQYEKLSTIDSLVEPEISNALKNNLRSVYTAFDPYPSYKGSAIHIEKVTEVMAQKYESVMLLTLPAGKRQALGKGIAHAEFPNEEPNYLRRAAAYSKWVGEQLSQQYNLEVAHFRDIWGGLPILEHQHLTTVFEVNGLPSIELADRYASLSGRTLDKLRALEDHCLAECSVIICPSQTIRAHLLKRGISERKIHVIPNGATLPKRFPKPAGLPTSYLVYFGALQPWQGITTLFKALNYLQDKPELHLVVCSSHKEKVARPFQKQLKKLGLQDRVLWKYQLERESLQAVVQHALCSVAPLTECSRNLEQGCSPLKLFESMACQTPIVASDLPVVREILTPEEAKFFRAERPAELARCIRLLADHPQFSHEMAQRAYQKVASEYTWDRIDEKLSYIYENLTELAF